MDKTYDPWTNIAGKRPKQKLTTGKFRSRKKLQAEVNRLRQEGETYSSISRKCLVSVYVVRSILIKGNSNNDASGRAESGACD